MKLSELGVKRPVTALMVFLAILILGYISYTKQGKAFGVNRFWAKGSGHNFRTVNLDHSMTSRPEHPEYLETYFDKKTNKTLTWNGKTWVDAMGNPVD